MVFDGCGKGIPFNNKIVVVNFTSEYIITKLI